VVIFPTPGMSRRHAWLPVARFGRLAQTSVFLMSATFAAANGDFASAFRGGVDLPPRPVFSPGESSVK